MSLFESTVIDTKDYSFLIVDKAKPINERYILVKKGIESEYIDILNYV